MDATWASSKTVACWPRPPPHAHPVQQHVTDARILLPHHGLLLQRCLTACQLFITVLLARHARAQSSSPLAAAETLALEHSPSPHCPPPPPAATLPEPTPGVRRSVPRSVVACIPRKEREMPRITISINAPDEPADQELLNLDLPPGLTLVDLKGFVQVEANFPVNSQYFFYNGQPLAGDSMTLEQAGIKDDDMLVVMIRRQGQRQQAQAQPQAQRAAQQAGRPRRSQQDDETETTRLRILGDHNALRSLQDSRPELAAAVNDPNRWREEWINMKRIQEEQQREHQRQLDLLNADPFNIEAQSKIEEMIRQERVIENLQHAYEHNPEGKSSVVSSFVELFSIPIFGRVTMLYINCEVNGQPVKAFVDSGAQATIMSPSCAEACGIKRLIDNRYAGMAVGVGTAKILGRVHHAEISIGGAIMPCAFTVMEGKSVDLLFGLDMLKRYKAKIDLEKNCLCFEGIEVPFLPESEIPKSFERAQMDEPTVSGPNGTEVGTRSGAVRPAAGSTTATSSGSAGESSSSAQAHQGSRLQGQGRTLGTPEQRNVSATSFPASDIDQLVGLGFSREQAINALRACGGNVEYAASLLFQG
ncbi:dna damage-inducible protein 1 [Diplodia corticola]|uniref:DNA damage-inducible protein 1 n=1 Tax=Diplodia corticola TaxID=236234 RepID=A0A1J9QNE0_9PEZI|nr:dna damage-inducible protein 1 [Diplodia corticola]OJD29578.1 dna damage-inducible protein 1 [Diplodia corticola]